MDESSARNTRELILHGKYGLVKNQNSFGRILVTLKQF